MALFPWVSDARVGLSVAPYAETPSSNSSDLEGHQGPDSLLVSGTSPGTLVHSQDRSRPLCLYSVISNVGISSPFSYKTFLYKRLIRRNKLTCKSVRTSAKLYSDRTCSLVKKSPNHGLKPMTVIWKHFSSKMVELSWRMVSCFFLVFPTISVCHHYRICFMLWDIQMSWFCWYRLQIPWEQEPLFISL